MTKIYAQRLDHFFLYACRITADYANYPLEVVIPDAEMVESKEFKNKKAHGKFPMLETDSGDVVFESNAIMSYIAREAGASALMGGSAAG